MDEHAAIVDLPALRFRYDRLGGIRAIPQRPRRVERHFVIGIPQSKLRRVLAAWEPPVSAIYAVYPGNRLMSMKVRAFVDHLARRFGQTPYWEDGL